MRHWVTSFQLLNRTSNMGRFAVGCKRGLALSYPAEAVLAAAAVFSAC
jgi:hypothetical protein